MKIWKKVFWDWKYVLLVFVVAFLFYALNVFIVDYATIVGSFGAAGFFETVVYFWGLLFDFWAIVSVLVFISIILISFLLGTLMALIVFKMKNVGGSASKKGGFLASVGAFMAMLVPGCAVCGVGLASVLGLGGIFAGVLPYKGLEFSFLAIILLVLANYFAIKSLSGCKLILK